MSRIVTLDDVSKTYVTRRGGMEVLRNVNLSVNEGERVGIIGGNGAGKSTLIRIIGGSERPTRGTLTRYRSISWPLAFSGGFQSALTGLDNLRFICRIYGVDAKDKLDFVDDFSELGRYLREPVRTYSAGMRARLAFAISLSIDFDCYLIDEIVAVGDRKFQLKCREELLERRRDKALIIVSHFPPLIADYCTRAAVLISGKLESFDSVSGATEYYESKN